MGLGEITDEKLDRPCDIRNVGHFVHGMDIPGGDRQRDRRNTGTRALQGTGVSSSARQEFELVANAVTLGNLAQMLNKWTTGQVGGIEDLNRYSLTEARDAIVRVNPRDITCNGDVEGDTDIGFETKGSCLRPTESDLLLDSSDCKDLHLVLLEMPECFQHNEDADAIIERLAQDSRTEARKVTRESHHITQLDARSHFVRWQAKINIEIFERRGLPFLTRQEMNRLGCELQSTEQRLTLTRPDRDTLRNEDAGIEATDGLEAEEALIVDVADQEADLVHMRGEHDPPISTATADADEVSHGVATEFINKWLEDRVNDRRDALLVARYARGFAQALKQLPIEFHRVTVPVQSRPSAAALILALSVNQPKWRVARGVNRTATHSTSGAEEPRTQGKATGIRGKALRMCWLSPAGVLGRQAQEPPKRLVACTHHDPSSEHGLLCQLARSCTRRPLAPNKYTAACLVEGPPPTLVQAMTHAWPQRRRFRCLPKEYSRAVPCDLRGGAGVHWVALQGRMFW